MNSIGARCGGSDRGAWARSALSSWRCWPINRRSALRREQIAAADLARQSQQIQSIAKESQNETRRLASAIDTLNGDRDRLYSRVTVLEQGLDSVTGAIAHGKRTPPVRRRPRHPPPRPSPASRQPQCRPRGARLAGGPVDHDLHKPALAATQPRPLLRRRLARRRIHRKGRTAGGPKPAPAVAPVGNRARNAGHAGRPLPVRRPRSRLRRPQHRPTSQWRQTAGSDTGNAADGREIDDGSARAGGRKTARTRQTAELIAAAPSRKSSPRRRSADDAEADAGEGRCPSRRAANRIWRRCRRREFGRRLARAVARASEVEIECGAGRLCARSS